MVKVFFLIFLGVMTVFLMLFSRRASHISCSSRFWFWRRSRVCPRSGFHVNLLFFWILMIAGARVLCICEEEYRSLSVAVKMIFANLLYVMGGLCCAWWLIDVA